MDSPEDGTWKEKRRFRILCANCTLISFSVPYGRGTETSLSIYFYPLFLLLKYRIAVHIEMFILKALESKDFYSIPVLRVSKLWAYLK